MARANVRDALVLIALVAAGAAATIYFGERIGVNHGTGWDGQAYAAWAKDFPHEVLAGKLTDYQSLRVLPSALIYYITSGQADPIFGFQVLDAVALVIAAALLARIAIARGWRRSTAWAAFAATFLSFGEARDALYNPVLTDSVAFALGMATVWAFVERRPIAQWVTAFAAMFTWPALAPIGFAMLVCPRPRATRVAPPSRWQKWAPYVVALVAAAFVVAWLVEETMNPFPGTELWLERSRQDLWPVTIGVSAAWVAAAAGLVAREPATWQFWSYLRDRGVWRIVIAAVACGAIVGARMWWLDRVGHEPGIDLVAIQHLIAAHSLRAPAWNLVHHVVYFGPVIVLAIVAWPRLATVAAAWGPGAVLALGMTVVVAMTTESRLLHHAMPLLIVLVFDATADTWTWWRAAAFAAIAVPWSKVWLEIGYTEAHDPRAWPDLRYTMHQGPWASDETFLVHAAAAVVTAGLLAWLVRKRA